MLGALPQPVTGVWHLEAFSKAFMFFIAHHIKSTTLYLKQMKTF